MNGSRSCRILLSSSSSRRAPRSGATRGDRRGHSKPSLPPSFRSRPLRWRVRGGAHRRCAHRVQSAPECSIHGRDGCAFGKQLPRQHPAFAKAAPRLRDACRDRRHTCRDQRRHTVYERRRRHFLAGARGAGARPSRFTGRRGPARAGPASVARAMQPHGRGNPRTIKRARGTGRRRAGRMDYDLIVVGAGPGGSAAAYALARRGERRNLQTEEAAATSRAAVACP